MELHDSHLYSKGRPVAAAISVGDILLCIVKGDPGDSGCWHRCLTQLLDNMDILAELYSEYNKGTCSNTLQQPVQQLYPLELNCRAGNPALNDLCTYDKGLDLLDEYQDTLDGVGSGDSVED